MLDLPAPIPDDQRVDRLYAQRLAALSEVSRAVTSSLELNTLLLTLVELLRQSLDYYAVNVWLLTEPAEAVQLKAGLTPQGEDLSLSEVQLAMGEENSTPWVCQTGVHHLSNQTDPQSLPLGDRFPLAKSQLVLLLKIAQKHVGALEIISTQPSAFREEDIVLLRSLADQVTVAIRNATLYQAEQSRRRFAETLYQIGCALSSTIQLDEVLEQILRHLNECPFRPLRGGAARGRRAGIRRHARLRRQAGETAPVHSAAYRQHLCPGFNTAQPVSIPDVSLHPEWHQMEDLPAARAWMGVPLILR